jgi:hypothetical protein
VRIDIPSLLVRLRAQHVGANRGGIPSPEAVAMAAASWTMSTPGRFAAAGPRPGSAGSWAAPRERGGSTEDHRLGALPAGNGRPRTGPTITGGGMTAREDVLRRIREADAAAGHPGPPDHHRTGADAPGATPSIRRSAPRWPSRGVTQEELAATGLAANPTTRGP